VTAADLHKTLLDHLSTAIILLDPQLQLRHVNSAAEALLSINNERHRGEPISHIFYESADTADELLQAIGHMSHYTKRHTEWQLHSGHRIAVDYTVTPLSQSEGLIIEVLPIGRLLHISRGETLAASQEATRGLIRGMAHEIKNPLGGIRGAAQLLARELPDEALSEYTAIIIAETDRLRNLVDRMLGPNQLPQQGKVNIHEVLERAATMIRAESRDQVRIVRDYDPSLPELAGDPEMLMQAHLNIARNAMQAMLEQPATAATPTLTLRSRIRRQFTIGRQHHPLIIAIELIDNGPGVPAPMAKQIFYPMISGRAKGSGLGLTISQHLIHQHQGLIECHSEPGNTCFSVFLPLDLNSSKTSTATRGPHAPV
jgi:two-component system nitrogen regulation sensor histidine kinase GlnL